MKIIALCASGKTIRRIVEPMQQAAMERGIKDFVIETDSFLRTAQLVDEYDILVYFPALEQFAENARIKFPNKRIITLTNEICKRHDPNELFDIIIGDKEEN